MVWQNFSNIQKYGPMHARKCSYFSHHLLCPRDFFFLSILSKSFSNSNNHLWETTYKHLLWLSTIKILLSLILKACVCAMRVDDQHHLHWQWLPSSMHSMVVVDYNVSMLIMSVTYWNAHIGTYTIYTHVHSVECNDGKWCWSSFSFRMQQGSWGWNRWMHKQL